MVLAAEFNLGIVVGLPKPIVDNDPIHMGHPPHAWRFATVSNDQHHEWVAVVRSLLSHAELADQQQWYASLQSHQQELIRLKDTDVPAAAPMCTTGEEWLAVGFNNDFGQRWFSVHPHIPNMSWALESPREADLAGRSLGKAMARYHLTTAEYDPVKRALFGTVWGDAKPGNSLLHADHSVTMIDFEHAGEGTIVTDLIYLLDQLERLGARLELNEHILNRLQTSIFVSYFGSYRSADRAELGNLLLNDFSRTPEFANLPSPLRTQLIFGFAPEIG